MRLKDVIIAERKFRFAGHIMQMAPELPALCVMDWTPADGIELKRPTKEDLAVNIL